MEQGRRAEKKVVELNDAFFHERTIQTLVRESNEIQEGPSPKKKVRFFENKL